MLGRLCARFELAPLLVKAQRLLYLTRNPALTLAHDAASIPLAASARDESTLEELPAAALAGLARAPRECTGNPVATIAGGTAAAGCFLHHETISVAHPAEAGPGTVKACGLNSICHRRHSMCSSSRVRRLPVRASGTRRPDGRACAGRSRLGPGGGPHVARAPHDRRSSG